MSTKRSSLAALAGLVLTIVSLIVLAPTALAQPAPDVPGYQENIATPPPIPSVDQVSYGSPIWVFVVVAAVAVLLTISALLAAPKLRRLHAANA